MNIFSEGVDRIFDISFPDFNCEYIMKDNFISLYFTIDTNYIDNCFSFKKRITNYESCELWETLFKIAILLFNKNFNVSLVQQIEVNFVSNQDKETYDYSFMFRYKNSNKFIGQITKKEINKYFKKFNK